MNQPSSSLAALAQAYELAHQLYSSGALVEAKSACEAILGADPAQAETLLLLGVCLDQLGQPDQALKATALAARLKPDFAQAHFNLGRLFRAQGDPERALHSYQRVIELQPQWTETYLNGGNCLMDMERFQAAALAFRRGLELDPGFADVAVALCGAAEALHRQGHDEDALDAYSGVPPASSSCAQALNGRGLLHMTQGSWQIALEDFECALVQRPDYAPAHNNRGMALQALGDRQAALESYRRALSLDPTHAPAWYNQGKALHETLQLEAAEASYRKAIDLKPDDVDAHWNLGLLLLLRGEFRAGWEEYEWRLRLGGCNSEGRVGASSPFPWPVWAPGVVVRVRCEQGLGDTLQFCRLVLPLAEAGVHVFLEVQQPLVSLLGQLPEGVHVLAQGAQGADGMDVDSYPLLSLPRLMGIDLASIPAPIPYLRAPKECREAWAGRLGSRQGRRRVGLAWSGSPTHKGDVERSIPLALFAPLFNVAETEFYCLQPAVRGGDEAALQRLPLRYFGDQLNDFTDTAALVDEMDVVISVDTSVAHLAGAMGNPVWILLPYFPDWRWLLERQDSPWYPTARLFRQSEPGDWTSVIAQVAEALADIK
jgi:tetratricopeptide (TPR) repeat protein